jgi:hypothetical protein
MQIAVVQLHSATVTFIQQNVQFCRGYAERTALFQRVAPGAYTSTAGYSLQLYAPYLVLNGRGESFALSRVSNADAQEKVRRFEARLSVFASSFHPPPVPAFTHCR